MSITTAPTEYAPASSTRWIQLGLGLICMMAISSPQYVWTVFTKPLGAGLNAPAAAIQVTFSIVIVLQTFFSPFQGWLVDRFGPKVLISSGCALTGLGWVLAAQAGSLLGLYATYGLLCGLGTGIVYVGVVGLVVRWFPERRGFAAGVVAAGYGIGALFANAPIINSLAAEGLAPTLTKFGVIIGVIGAVAALGLRSPPAVYAAQVAGGSSVRDVETGTMLKSPIFWLMFLMMTMMSTTGLMVVSQIGTFANDFGVAKMTVFGTAAMIVTLNVDRFCNGITRPFFGWVSDKIGRENTMGLAFGLEAIAMVVWMMTITHPVAFVLLSGLVFFGWGEIFSLFPSTLTDTFGTKNATRNYGCLYIAQGIGSILGGPMASLLHDAAGSWTPVFGVAIGCDLATAVLAYFVLKPMRARYMAA
jgi:OFA family oxalate/formate antiporter-like MFS transporter